MFGVGRRTVGGGGETSGRRLQRTGIAAAAPRTAPDGPPTDSEHAECTSELRRHKVVKNADIADTLQLRNVTTATIFQLSTVYIGAT